jgi:phosphinothricin acetyltransferase
MKVRPARDGDIPAILALWNPQIRETTITFSSEEKTAAGLREMIAVRRAAACEFFVAEAGADDGGGQGGGGQGGLLGLATYAQFRAGNGYAYSMEHTVVISPGAWGRGVGRALMAAVETHARAAGFHTMVAAVTGENARALAFHRAMGYADVGLLPEQGRKFGRWLDLVLLQKSL